MKKLSLMLVMMGKMMEGGNEENRKRIRIGLSLAWLLSIVKFFDVHTILLMKFI